MALEAEETGAKRGKKSMVRGRRGRPEGREESDGESDKRQVEKNLDDQVGAEVEVGVGQTRRSKSATCCVM